MTTTVVFIVGSFACGSILHEFIFLHFWNLVTVRGLRIKFTSDSLSLRVNMQIIMKIGIIVIAEQGKT